MKNVRIALSVLPLLWALAQADPPASPPAAPWTKLYADEAWYKSHQEPEQVFSGVLQRNKEPESSTLMRSKRYQLGDRSLYPGKEHPDLEKLVGQKVEIKGKPCDMELEGQSVREIWPAAIRSSAAATQPATSTKPAEKGGLQVTVIAEQPKAVEGDPLTIRVEMKNTLDRAARLYTSTSHWQWRFQPPDGKGYWKLDQRFAEDRVWSASIPPGKADSKSFATHSARGQEYVFTWVGDEKKVPASRNSLPAGRYRLTIDMTLSTYSRPGNTPEPWEGDLTTTPVEFEVIPKEP